ncbi:restriction endonuclease subunit S [Flavobacterium sp. ZB4P13]|uniref:restriction endonuclease subunit S n=1 Tax=Flavobacterium sp. ZB4P13 TaxID=3401728 RepID=UPI003AB007D9
MQKVKWGEYKLEDLFEIVGTKSLDSNAIDFTKTGINFVGRTFENNGIQGKIQKRNFEPNEPFSITATVIGNYKYVKYQTEPYYCSQNINKLTPKTIFENWNKKIAYYLIVSLQKFVSLYDSQQGGYKLEDIKNHKIQLPIKNNKLDFEFMESFIAELEAERITKLENYLIENNLKDYILTKEEEQVLNKFNDIEWGEFRLEVLFEKITTKKLSFKADELPKQIIDKYTLPCLTSSFKNQGLNYFVPQDGATILKNVISIPSNSDIYRAYFQSNEFTVLSDAYAIRWVFDGYKLLPKQYLFAVQCINKVTDLSIYSYKNKLGGWNVVKNKFIQLPIKENKPDYEFMETLISAVQKLAIKDVVLYVNNKING